MENLLMSRKRAIVDIDFRRQAVGDTVIRDYGGNIWTPSGGGGVVVNDPILGLAMQFSGGYFSAVLPTRLDLKNIAYLVEITYRLTAAGTLWASGDATSSPKSAGLVINSAVSTASAEISVTPVDNNLGSFTMSTAGKWASNQRSKFAYTARPGGGETLKLWHNDVLVSNDSFSNHWAGRGGNVMRIGLPVKATTSSLRGSIQSIKISKTP